MDQIQRLKNYSKKRISDDFKNITISKFAKKAFGLELAPFHKEVCKTLLIYKNCLFIIPRGHGKTTLLCQIYPSWLLFNDPRWQIVIASNKYDMAVASVLVVKQVLELLGLKPEQKISGQWRQNVIVLDRPYISKDPSLKAISETSEDTGTHAHKIICDDLVTKKTTLTKMRRDRLVEFYDATIQNMLLPGGQLVTDGNHWHFDDLYVTLKERKGKDKKLIFEQGNNMLFYQAIKDRENKEVLWPEHFPFDTLMDIEDNVTPVHFACQYQNNPAALKGQYLDVEWIAYQDFNSLEEFRQFPSKKRLQIIQAWDIAWTLEEENDYTVCVTLGYEDKPGRFYLLDIYREHVAPAEIPRLMQEQFIIYKPQTVIFEDIAKEGKAVEAFLALQNVSLPIEPIKHPSGSKEDRILRGISRWYRDRRVVHPTINEEHLSWQKYFDDEYVQFPRSKHDDILDALEMGIRGTIEGHQFMPIFLPAASRYINDIW